MTFITEEDLAKMQTKHMDDCETTIMNGSGNASIDASTASVSDRSEFTSTASVLPEEYVGHPFIMTFTEGLIRDCSVSYVAHIVECLEDGTYRIALENLNTRYSLTGRCQKGAEQSVSSDEEPKSDEQAE
jgi:hypothetical protein